MHTVMQSSRKGAVGVFLFECTVKKASFAASVKLEALESDDADSDVETAAKRSEYTYDVEAVQTVQPGESFATIETDVHESLVFASIPTGWTRKDLIYLTVNENINPHKNPAEYRIQHRLAVFRPPKGVFKG